MATQSDYIIVQEDDIDILDELDGVLLNVSCPMTMLVIPGYIDHTTIKRKPTLIDPMDAMERGEDII